MFIEPLNPGALSADKDINCLYCRTPTKTRYDYLKFLATGKSASCFTSMTNKQSCKIRFHFIFTWANSPLWNFICGKILAKDLFVDSETIIAFGKK